MMAKCFLVCATSLPMLGQLAPASSSAFTPQWFLPHRRGRSVIELRSKRQRIPLTLGTANSQQQDARWHCVGRDEIDGKRETLGGLPLAVSRRDAIRQSPAAAFVAAVLFGLPRVGSASTKDPRTGIVLPSEGEIESSIPTDWDEESPFNSMGRDKFARLDSKPDSVFYAEPRFVEHVDENAVRAITGYISGRVLRPGDSVLDLCSSWTSHIDPVALQRLGLKRVAGLGMNEKELRANQALTEWTIQDLNAESSPGLPYESLSFDVVLCQLSIDYLTRPLEVMREAGRVLKPGGRIAIIFSNRLFISKAVGLWTGADDIDHAYTVGSYLHYSNGCFEDIKAEDLSTRKGVRGKDRPIVGDPLYVVTATKSINDAS